MENLIENHFLVQEGMYFSRRLDSDEFSIFMSDLIEDNYWNYACITNQVNLSNILQDIEDEFEKNHRPCCIYLTSDREKLVAEVSILERNNYQETSRESFMVFNGMQLRSRKPLLELATQREHFGLFKDVFVKAYGGERTPEQPYGALPDTYIKALERSFSRPDKFFNFICYDNSNPVSIASLCFHEGLGGIYNVGTDPQYRGRGYGLSVTVACIDMWRKLNGTQLFLQTETGSAVEAWYKKLGFEVHFNGIFCSKAET